MKKIAIVSSLNGLGGTEISLINFLKSVPKNTIEVDLLLMGGNGPLINQVPSWITIKTIKQYSPKEYIVSAFKKLNIKKVFIGTINYFKIKKLIRTYKTDTMRQYKMSMYLFNRNNEHYDIAVSWYVPKSFETVYTLENVIAYRKVLWIHMDVQHDSMPSDALDIFRKYDKIFCVSKACKNSFDLRYPNCSGKTEVYYNIIPTQDIITAGLDNIKEIKPDKSLVILTCGRITYEKQPLFAIKIVKELLISGHKDFVWYFIGDGAMRQEFDSAISENHLEKYIIILGFRTNPYAYLSKADIYIQMSLHESFCLTLAEAQVLGVPSITTDFPSAHEIVIDKKTGYIVENNWKSIFQKISLLLDNSIMLEEMKSELRNYKLLSNGDVSKFLKYVEEINLEK